MNFSLFLTRLDKLAYVMRSKRLLRILLSDHVFAGVEHRKIISPDLMTVIDIGANRGQFSLAVRDIAPEARIYAFEPIADPASRFRKIFKADVKVRLHHAAIGPEPGEKIIHVTASDDSSSLLPVSDVQERIFPGSGEVRTENIRVGRLCDYVSAEEIVPPALLKLDVQGFELQALLGCEDYLKRFTWIYAECSFMELYKGQAFADEIIAWLRKRGFWLSGVYNMTYDRNGRAVQGDFLFYNRHINLSRQNL